MALLLLNGEHECHPRFQNWPQLHHEGISGSFPDTAVESHVRCVPFNRVRLIHPGKILLQDFIELRHAFARFIPQDALDDNHVIGNADFS